MGIQVKVIRGDGDKEAPSIEDDMITTESMAVSRGKRYLDDPIQGAYYSTVKRSFPQLVHKSPDVYPSKWLEVTESRLGLENKRMKVLSYSISITKTGVWASMETEEYLEVSDG